LCDLGAFGFGLNEKVCEAYTFLVNNYGPGDEIFIFGFSRGEYKRLLIVVMKLTHFVSQAHTLLGRWPASSAKSACSVLA